MSLQLFIILLSVVIVVLGLILKGIASLFESNINILSRTAHDQYSYVIGVCNAGSYCLDTGIVVLLIACSL